MRLVERQLQRKLGLGTEELSPQWRQFIDLIDATYGESDRERALLEHVLGAASEEVLGRNEELRAELEKRREAEAALRQLSEDATRAAAEWRGTFDAVADPLLVMTQELEIKRLNRASAVLANRPLTDLLNLNLRSLGPTQPWRTVLELAESQQDTASVQDASSGQAWHVRIVWVDLVDGRRCIASMRDTTELERLQESLRRSETLSALGALVGSVAHEVRNPLFAIGATLDALELSFPPSLSGRELLGSLRGQLGRLNDLVRDLLEYGRPAPLDHHPQSLAQILQAAAAECALLAKGSGVRLIVDTEPLPPVSVDRSRVIQVFTNLVQNAINHSSPGGEVVALAVPQSRRGQPGLRVDILDRGPGIVESDRHRLFEPFFTRRKDGVGLGLCVVQRIVDDHRGSVEIANRDGGGARAIVWLPLAGPGPADG